MKKYKEIRNMKTNSIRKVILINIFLFRTILILIINDLKRLIKLHIIPLFNKLEKLIYNSACNIFDIS